MSKTMDIVIGGWNPKEYPLNKDTIVQVYAKAAHWTRPLVNGETRWISIDALEPIGSRIEWCEGCEKLFLKEEISEDYCESCYAHIFCECGQRLEDAYGSPGDGFCVRCR